MSLQINKSVVPRVAVERTVRRGIELWSLAHDNKPAPKEVVDKITMEVHRLANHMNSQGGKGPDEARNSAIIH